MEANGPTGRREGPQVEWEGVEVNVFFSPSFDMCKEEGKRVSFFRKTFFSLLIG